MRKRWWKKAALVLIGIAIVGAIAYGLRPRPVEVDLGIAQRGPLRVTIDEEGRTRIKERYIVSTPLAGQLDRIRLKPGHDVKSGKTMLAVLEPTDPTLLDPRTKAQSQARVRSTEAGHSQVKANLERAKEAHLMARTQHARGKELFRTEGSIPREEVEALDRKERMAQEDVKAAEFALRVAAFEHELAKAALLRAGPRSALPEEDDRFEIRSPIDGKVLRVFQESTAVVQAGAKLIEIGDPNDLEMEIDVLSTDAVKISPGAKVIVERWGGDAPLMGKVRLIEPGAFLKVSALGVEEQRVNIIADFDESADKYRRLGDAFRIEARFVIWEANDVLKVPAGALFRHNGGWAVFTVEHGQATLTPVKIGRSNGLETEIVEGLQADVRVILHPGDRVKPGAQVVGR